MVRNCPGRLMICDTDRVFGRAAYLKVLRRSVRDIGLHWLKLLPWLVRVIIDQWHE